MLCRQELDDLVCVRFVFGLDVFQAWRLTFAELCREALHKLLEATRDEGDELGRGIDEHMGRWRDLTGI